MTARLASRLTVRPLPDWKRLDELDVPTGSPFLIDGLIHATSTTIFGRPGSGKGWVAESMAFAIQNSPTWFGRDVLVAGDVAFWPLDPGQPSELKSRAEGLEGVLPYIPDVRPDLTIEGFSDFAEDLERANVRVLIVDNLFRLLPADQSIRNDEHVRVVLQKLDRIIARDVAVVLIHHAGKPGETGTPKTPIGSTSIEAWSRHFLRVEQDKSGLVRISSYGNNAQAFEIKARIDPTACGDTPFFADIAESKPHERSEDRIIEATVVATHMAKVGTFKSVLAAAEYLVEDPPPGVRPRAKSAWRNYIDHRVLGLGLYVRGSGYSIHPRLEER